MANALRETLDALLTAGENLRSFDEHTGDAEAYELVARMRLFARLGVYQAAELEAAAPEMAELTDHLRAIAVLFDRALALYPKVDDQAIFNAGAHMAFVQEFLRAVDELPADGAPDPEGP